MSYVLTGSTYIGTGSLPTPVAGYSAIDTTTGNEYRANTSATAWNLVGNVNSTNLGLLPISGGAMTGAITGATGWAPLDSPDFTTSAKKGGLDLATTADLATTSNNILNSISPKITEAVAATSAGITVKANIAWAVGVLTFAAGASQPAAQTIPLPTYPDGTTAVQSDCKWVVAPIELGFGVGLAGPNNQVFQYSADPTTTRTFAAFTLDSNGLGYLQVKVMYFIIGVKS